MSDVTIKHLQVFVAVVDLGTFRRAAERPNTTRPNVSGRIARLEERPGATPMERDAGSVRLAIGHRDSPGSPARRGPSGRPATKSTS